MKRSLASALATLCLLLPAPLLAADEAAKPAIVQKYVLPKDKDAVVVEYDMRQPIERINFAPSLTVLADGRVNVAACYAGQKAFEGRLTPDELQELLHFVVGQQKFFEHNAEKLDAKITAKGRLLPPPGGMQSFIRVNLEGKTHEATLTGGCDVHRDIPELEQLKAVSFRLQKLRFLVMLGGTPAMQEYLRKANEKLKTAFPQAAPLDLSHVTSTIYRDDGGRAIDFRRQVKNAEGQQTSLTDVSIYISPAGEMRIGAQHTGE